MKTIKARLIAAVVLAILASPIQSFGIVGLGIEQQCTNIVISWPSQGYEFYLIQFRPTLDPPTPWENLTNNFPANSTNRTTFTITGVAAPCSGGGGDSLMSREESAPAVPLVVPKDKSKPPVPLGVYPPGFDLSGWIIIWPDGSTDEWSAELVEKWRASQQEVGGGPGPESDGPVPGDNSGFFRVFHIPDWAFNVTNYYYDGPTFFPVDFKDYREKVKKIEVLLDGEPTGLADFTSLFYNGQTNWGMGIYFDRIPNGTHQIQLVSTLHLNDAADDEAVFLTLSNLTRSIVVDNQVWFTNWEDMAWTLTNYAFRAQTKNLDTYWAIDIYDAWGFWISGTSGHTTNGHIEWTWDLRDFNGDLRDNLDFDPFFDPWITFDDASASAPSGGNGPAAAQTSRPTPPAIIPYPELGAWVISFQDHFYDPGTSSYAKMVDAMHAIQGWVDYRDVPTQYFPIAYGTNDGYTQADRDDDWFTLKSLLKQGDFRNFYYFGHGNSNSIGGDLNSHSNGVVTGSDNLPGGKAYLLSSTVVSEVTFNKTIGVRPYRFVWLDGCNTALGGWPAAFGVNKGTNDLDYYTNSITNPQHKRPSAFVGWATKPGGDGWGTVTGFFNSRSEWIKQWSYYWQTEALVDALEYGRYSSDWIQSGQFWGGIRVYGYTILRMNAYNWNQNWPGP